jgi:hypothetical protein
MAYRPPTLPSFNCTYGSASNQTPNAQYGVGGALGLAFSSIAQANANWTAQKNNAVATGQHWGLPNGTHYIGGTKVIKSDSCIRYENPNTNGHCYGVTADGQTYQYTN